MKSCTTTKSGTTKSQVSSNKSSRSASRSSSFTRKASAEKRSSVAIAKAIEKESVKQELKTEENMSSEIKTESSIAIGQVDQTVTKTELTKNSSSEHTSTKTIKSVRRSQTKEFQKGVTTNSDTKIETIENGKSEKNQYATLSRKASKSAHEETKLIEQSATTSQEVVNKKSMANTLNNATIRYPKTTMVVRLQPGEDKTLSAYLDEQVVDPSEPGGSSYKRRWLTDVSADKGSQAAICGLEISFSHVPQDLDIKLIQTKEGDMCPPQSVC